MNSAKFNLSGGSPTEEQLIEYNNTEINNPTTANYGFIDYQGPEGLIPDNIGYVNISYLINPLEGADKTNEKCHRGPGAIKRLNDILKSFQQKQGIIIDLSLSEHGGNPAMVQQIVSYFIPEGTLINTIYNRSTDQQTVYESVNTLKLDDKPVVILIGPTTFSGREEIAYDLQQFNKTLDEKEKRFVVMGQSTKGGAHPMSAFPLMDQQTKEINDKLVLLVPYETSINPISGTNWEDGPTLEGREPGVQPDIEIPKDQNALKAAVEHLSSMIIQQSKPVKLTQRFKEKIRETKEDGPNLNEDAENKNLKF
ncbi:MAG: hypothetical protein H0U73_04140 [Tatlockia sp.]|nr:hypothetical protein [Tatlockia sp.]